MKLKLYIGHTPTLGRRSRMGSSRLGQSQCSDLFGSMPATIEGLVDNDALTVWRGISHLNAIKDTVDLMCDFGLEVDGFDPSACSGIRKEIQSSISKLEARKEERGPRF